MALVSRCHVSRPFSIDLVTRIVSQIEAHVLGKKRFGLLQSYREKQEPSFSFVVQRPVSLRCFDQGKVLDLVSVDFSTDRIDGKSAATRLRKIGDYVCRLDSIEGSPNAVSVAVHFGLDELPVMMNFFVDSLKLSFRSDIRPEGVTPETICKQINSMIEQFSSVTEVMPQFQVVNGIPKWAGPCKWDGIRSRYTVGMLPFGENGDSIDISMSKTHFPAVSKILSAIVSSSKKPVLVYVRMVLKLEHQASWLEAGPFDDGYLEYQVDDGPVDKSVQAAIRGRKSLDVEFVPLFSFAAKHGPSLNICLVITDSMGELVMGYGSESEPVDEGIFREFIEDAELAELFPEFK